MLHAHHADTGQAALDEAAETPPRRGWPAQDHGQGHAMLHAVCAFVLAGMACASQAQVIVAASAFETDRDGWTLDMLDPAATICCSSVTWMGGGGSPGGALSLALRLQTLDERKRP